MKKLTLFIKRLIRIIFYLGLVGILVVAAQWKIKEITKEQKKEILSRVSLWEKNGHPIDVVKVKRASLPIYTKLTARLVSNGVLESDVTRNIQQQLGPKMPLIARIKGKEYKGAIEKVSPVADLESGLFRVLMKLTEAIPVDQKKAIAAVTVRSSAYKNSLAVSKEALIVAEGKREGFVWVAKFNRAMKTPVKLSGGNGELVRVKEGIGDGDLIIIRGISKLKEFAKVQVHKCINCE